VFVIERVDTLNDESANRMLKTLEEPAPYVHLILLTDRLSEVLPTIASRCQLVRFDALGGDEIAAALSSREGVAEATARACARLALGDGDVATALASGEGAQLREAAEGWARAVLAGRAAERPWDALLALCRARGAAAEADVDAALEDALGVAARGEQSRLKTEFSERRRRMKRRAETAALDLGLQLVGQWLRDVACVCWEADEVVRNLDRLEALREDAEGRDGAVLRAGVELVEQTRLRLQFNVGEALACEALAYRLEELLAR
jgi:DNA polymerase-3 subunit delta'